MSEGVDLEAVKQIPQKVRSEGDFSMVGGTQVHTSELVVRAARHRARRALDHGGDRAMLVDAEYLEVVAVRA